MKKTTGIYLAAGLMLCFASASYSQGIYFDLGLGYNFSAASSVLGVESTESSSGFETNEVVCGSMGKGFGGGLGVGYMFSKNCGFEFNFSYLSGSEYEIKSTGTGYLETQTAKGKMIRITPALRVATSGEKIKGYCKFGPVIGVGTKVDVEETGSYSMGGGYSSSWNNEYNYSGGISVGLMGAAGIEFNLSDMFGIYFELNSISQSWAPKEMEFTETETNVGPFGVDTETDAGNVDFKDKVDDNDVDKELKEFIPFSSVGIKAGIKLTFGGGSE